jgi:hypothetical protein
MSPLYRQLYAMEALANIGARARPALPDLIRFANNETYPERVRKMAAKAAKKIDPAAAAAAGIE